MTTNAQKIRKLSAAGYTSEEIAKRLKVEVRAVNQTLRRVLKNQPGTSDAIVEHAEAVGFHSMDLVQREQAVHAIAAALSRLPSEVRRVLTPVNPQGRPKNPVCEACAQRIPANLYDAEAQERVKVGLKLLEAYECQDEIKQGKLYLAFARMAGKVIRHKDGNPSNHHIDNIEIRDAEENE